jgi:hypothetical protein
MEQTAQQHPVATGVAKSIGGTVGGMIASPEYYPLMFTPFSTAAPQILRLLVDAGMTYQMANSAVNQATDLGTNWDSMSTEQKSKAITDLSTTTVMAGTVGAKGTEEAAPLIRDNIVRPAVDLSRAVIDKARVPTAKIAMTAERLTTPKNLIARPVGGTLGATVGSLFGQPALGAIGGEEAAANLLEKTFPKAANLHPELPESIINPRTRAEVETGRAVSKAQANLGKAQRAAKPYAEVSGEEAERLREDVKNKEQDLEDAKQSAARTKSVNRERIRTWHDPEAARAFNEQSEATGPMSREEAEQRSKDYQEQTEREAEQARWNTQGQRYGAQVKDLIKEGPDVKPSETERARQEAQDAEDRNAEADKQAWDERYNRAQQAESERVKSEREQAQAQKQADARAQKAGYPNPEVPYAPAPSYPSPDDSPLGTAYRSPEVPPVEPTVKVGDTVSHKNGGQPGKVLGTFKHTDGVIYAQIEGQKGYVPVADLVQAPAPAEAPIRDPFNVKRPGEVQPEVITPKTPVMPRETGEIPLAEGGGTLVRPRPLLTEGNPLGRIGGTEPTPSTPEAPKPSLDRLKPNEGGPESAFEKIKGPGLEDEYNYRATNPKQWLEENKASSADHSELEQRLMEMPKDEFLKAAEAKGIPTDNYNVRESLREGGSKHATGRQQVARQVIESLSPEERENFLRNAQDIKDNPDTAQLPIKERAKLLFKALWDRTEAEAGAPGTVGKPWADAASKPEYSNSSDSNSTTHRVEVPGAGAIEATEFHGQKGTWTITESNMGSSAGQGHGFNALELMAKKAKAAGAILKSGGSIGENARAGVQGVWEKLRRVGFPVEGNINAGYRIPATKGASPISSQRQAIKAQFQSGGAMNPSSRSAAAGRLRDALAKLKK